MRIRTTPFGSPAYDALRDAVAEAKNGDPLQLVTLVVPGEYVGVNARRALAGGLREGSAGIAALTVLTFRRLGERLAGNRLASDGRRPLTPPLLAAAVREVLADKPGLFEPVATHVGTARAIADAHRRLRTLEATQVDRIAEQGGPLAAEVVRISRAIRAGTKDAWFDPVDLLEAATRAAQDRPPLVRELGPIVVFLPDDLDVHEIALLHRLATTTAVTMIAGVTGNERADAGIRRTLLALGHEAPPATVGAEPHGTAILHASDPDDETREVVRRVIDALDQRPGHRVAVLYGAPDPYARLLHEHFTAAGVTTHGRGVRPTVERVVGRTLLQLLDLPRHDFRRDDVMASLADGAVYANGRRAPSNQWERLSRAAGVIKGKDWDRLTALAAERRADAAKERAAPEPKQWRIDRLERDADGADALYVFIADLAHRLDQIHQAESWNDLVDHTTSLWDDLLGGDGVVRLPEDERLAALRVDTTLRGLRGLDDLRLRPSRQALQEILELELADDLDRVGASGAGVHVGPLTDALGLNLDMVVVVGLAEGLVPSRPHEDPLLPDTVCALTDGGLPTLAERVDRQHRRLLAALAATPISGVRLLTLPRGDLRRGGQRVASRWLLPTIRQLIRDPTVQATTWRHATRDCADITELPSHATAIERTVFPGNETEWRQRRAVIARANGKDLAAVFADDVAAVRALTIVRERLSARFTRFDGNLAGQRLPDPTSLDSVSPTALETWTACPHGYFIRHLLGVYPVESPEEILRIAATERGSLMHKVLERFIEEALTAKLPLPEPGAPWSRRARRRLEQIAEEECRRVELAGLTGFGLLWEQDRAAILADLSDFLTYDDVRRERERLTPLATELPFGHDGEPPVEMDLGSGRVLHMRGTADRVDRRDDGSLVVTDYKSGSAKPYDGLHGDNPVDGGHKLQLPTYALAARAKFGTPTTKVRSVYWFITRRSKFDIVGYDVTNTVMDKARGAVTVIVDGIKAGVFPARPVSDSGAYGCDYCAVTGMPEAEQAAAWERLADAEELGAYHTMIYGRAGEDSDD